MASTAPTLDTGFERPREGRGETGNRTGEGRTLIALFSDLFRETSTLVHQEAQLAKAELSEKVSEMSSGIAAIAVGGAIVFAGFIVLLFAAVGALELMLNNEHAVWLAPLIVGLAVIVIGFIALAMGKRAISTESLQPSRTMESLRRDTELVKEHVK
jgi:hypothetical protein